MSSARFFGRMADKARQLKASKTILPTSIAAGLLGASVFGSAVFASDAPNPPHHHWSHKGYFSAFDTASLRRGFEVYRQVCSSCHSLEYKTYRELVGTIHTEEQAKAIARTVEVTDGPNDQGEMFQRPGKLSDHFPKPYPNPEYASFINGGAIPPDLSLVVLGRHHGEDYVFSLLTGYREPPAGVELRQGLHWNTYFPGNAISMAKPLSDGQVEWEDSTPATVSQMAKDVTTFLAWCSMPEHDQRKKTGAKVVIALAALSLMMGVQKRRVWSPIKSRRVTYAQDNSL